MVFEVKRKWQEGHIIHQIVDFLYCNECSDIESQTHRRSQKLKYNNTRHSGLISNEPETMCKKSRITTALGWTA